MPTISFSCPTGPLTVNAHIGGNTARDVDVIDLVGRLDVVHALIADAHTILTP